MNDQQNQTQQTQDQAQSEAKPTIGQRMGHAIADPRVKNYAVTAAKGVGIVVAAGVAVGIGQFVAAKTVAALSA